MPAPTSPGAGVKAASSSERECIVLGRPDPYIRETGRGRQILNVLAGVDAPAFQVVAPRPAWKWRVSRWAARTAWRIVSRTVRKAVARRRILAPWYLGACVWVAAALAHLADRGWVTMATLGLAGAPALWWSLGLPMGRVRRRRRLPTVAQRWWYGTAYTLAAVWAVVAARWGAGPPRLGFLLTLVTVCWAAWCWHHRIRHDQPAQLGDVEQKWAAVPGMADTTLENIVEHASPRRVSFEVDLSETKLLVADVAKADTVAHVAKRFGVPRHNIVADYAPGLLEDRARVEVVYSNPLNDKVVYDKTWIPTGDEIAQGVVKFHTYPNGHIGRVRLWYPGAGTVNTLLSGDIGAGKSGGQETLMTQAAFTGRVWLMAADPQTGASMPAWCGAGGQARWQAICEPDDLGPIEAQMLFLREAMYDRTARMSQLSWVNKYGDEITGLGSWDYDIIAAASDHPWPAVGFHVAEFWRVMLEPGLVPLAKELLKLMRKAGFYLAMDTQYPAIQEFDNDMSLRQPLTAGNILCYRNTANTVKNMILPDGLPAPDGIPSETPDGDHTKGMLVAASQASKSSLPVYARTAWMERNTYWAKQAAPHQHQLEPELEKIRLKYMSAPAPAPAEPRREVVTISAAPPGAGRGTHFDRIVAYLQTAPDRRAHTGVIAAALDIPLPRVSEALSRGAKKGAVRQVRTGVWALSAESRTVTEEAA